MLGERSERDTTQQPERGAQQGASDALIGIAMICLVSMLVAVLFQAYGVVFRQLGSYGQGAVVVFLVPVLLGGAHLWRRGSFDA